MRVFGFALVVMIAFAVLGIDVGESLRTGTISDGVAQAKHHHRRHHKRRRHHHRRRHAPASEM